MEVREALALLGVERFAFGIHDACFPAYGGEDLGRGTPHSEASHHLLQFVAELGFDTVLLGPQGETSPQNASPYDGSVFSRSTLDLALPPLVEAGLLSAATLRRLAIGPATSRADHAGAHRAMAEALDEVHATFARQRSHDVEERIRAFLAAHGPRVASEGMFEALTVEHGGRDFAEWPSEIDRCLFIGERPGALERQHDIARRYRHVLDRWLLAQTLVHEQHRAFRERAHALGFALFADLQIGWSRRDVWLYRDRFLDGYLMGAPPSRTNPEGQPWGYPVLDPGKPDAAGRLIESRFAKVADEYDGIRVDHPHGLVCPWVYRAEDPDPIHAVQHGARLFEAPDLPDHPRLQPFAIARPEQLDRARVRWDERWVRELDDEQVARYAARIDRLRALTDRLACEVLSTMPYPLERVLARHGLGRFRVTQKVGLDDPRDVYRSENAQPEDWIMVGNHDTETIWSVAARWVQQGRGEAHARYLSERLIRKPEERAAFVARVARDPHALATAKLAELFASPARSIYVWWGDLFGEVDVYNRPGTVDPRNWSMRIPARFRELYEERRAAGAAFDVRRALAMALSARGMDDAASALLV